ncbi:MAG: FAD:protein FMN transferase, partial [Dehalococcoidia bacterium]|nr:FAD:protein FMN transferase [Dehalococcoidia bacterium]
MGTTVDVVVRSPERPLVAFASVRAWFGMVEARLSRFREGSAVWQVNRGEAVDDWMLAELARAAFAAWEATEGLVNPLILEALESAGYDESFERIQGSRGRLAAQPVPHPSAAIDIQGTTVRLKRGAIDLGGLAKGWAVDRAAELLEGMGLDALVNAGGDLRAVGEEAPGAGGWMVAIERPDGTIMWEGTTNAALATSSAMRRRWPTADGGWAHHLIDPRTGLPANSPYVQVTVAAERCLWAEVWSKAILIGGPETLQRASGNVSGVAAIRADGSVERWGCFDKGR